MPQFQPGNPGGPGGARPNSGPKPSQLRETAGRLIESIPFEDMREVVAKATELAKAGDPVARNWLFDRVFGRSSQPFMLEEVNRLRREVANLHTLAPLHYIGGLSDAHYRQILDHAEEELNKREARKQLQARLEEEPEEEETDQHMDG